MSPSRVGFLLVCSNLLVLQPCIAQQSSALTPQRDPQALNILAQCNAAMGATATVPDLYLQGTITPTNPNTPPSTFVLESKGTDRVRTEIDSPNGKQVFVVNDERGFSLTSGIKKNLALHLTSYFRPEHLSAFACSIDVARPNMGVAYAGEEIIGAATAYHLIFQAASSDPLDVIVSEFHVYVDSKTFRVLKTATWAFAPDAIENRSKWETYYDGYQPVGGILMPTHITHFVAGQKFDEWSFTSTRTDISVADGDFQ